MMVRDLDKKIVLDQIVEYDGPWETSYEALFYAEESDPVINNYVIENIIKDLLENGGYSKLNMYPVIKKTVDELKGEGSGFQVINNIPWTYDDILDVIQMVGKKLLPKLKKKLKGRKIFCRMYEDGVLEFRLNK